jgi:hypothetical protein
MIRQEYDERSNRQTARLTLLEEEMASTHRFHLKDYTLYTPNTNSLLRNRNRKKKHH